MGGQDAGPVDRAEHENDLWEKRIDGLLVALSVRPDPRHPTPAAAASLSPQQHCAADGVRKGSPAARAGGAHCAGRRIT